MKSLKVLHKISHYLLLISPILLTSFFVYNSKYPAWANTMLLASFIFAIYTISFALNARNKKEYNILEVALASLGIISALAFSFFTNKNFMFGMFGKGIAETSGASILFLFVVAAFFVSLRGKLNKSAMIISGAALAYTIINYVFVKNNLSIANYTGYINIPMLSFQKLINFASVFALVALLTSVLAFFIEKKGIVFSKVINSKLLKVILALVLIVSVVFFVRNVLRFVAANYYYKAATAFSENKTEDTKKYLDRAILVSPFDEYYLAKNEIGAIEINTLLNSRATNTAELQEKYKVLVELQIENAKSAVNYDKGNPRNYMALGTAYERSMLLSKDDGYAKAISAYDMARETANDKDYVDVVKAKASFGAEKESEALKYIDSALKYNASSSQALFVSSQYYASKNNLPAAVEYGEKAVITSPQAADARLSLGLLYLQGKNYDAAIQMFGSVLQLTRGENIGAMYYLAVSFKEKGDKDNLKLVITELEKRVSPDSKEMKDLKSGLAPKVEVKGEGEVKKK